MPQVKRSSVSVKDSQHGFIASIISLLFGLVIGILALRFVFRLLGANEANAFVSWIYQASTPLVAPFFGIFNASPDLTTGIFEVATLLAILVYGVIASLVTGILAGGSRRSHRV